MAPVAQIRSYRGTGLVELHRQALGQQMGRGGQTDRAGADDGNWQVFRVCDLHILSFQEYRSSEQKRGWL
jgi:hypothetical protein